MVSNGQASLFFFSAQLEAHAGRRCAELQAYCDECCELEALAGCDELAAFFWPSPEAGGGTVKAPDASVATIEPSGSYFR